jgi:hypothetical protein
MQAWTDSIDSSSSFSRDSADMLVNNSPLQVNSFLSVLDHLLIYMLTFRPGCPWLSTTGCSPSVGLDNSKHMSINIHLHPLLSLS